MVFFCLFVHFLLPLAWSVSTWRSSMKNLPSRCKSSLPRGTARNQTPRNSDASRDWPGNGSDLEGIECQSRWWWSVIVSCRLCVCVFFFFFLGGEGSVVGFHSIICIIYVIPWFPWLPYSTLRGLFPESTGDKLRHRGGSWQFLIGTCPLDFRQRGLLLVIIPSPSEEGMSIRHLMKWIPQFSTPLVSDEFDDFSWDFGDFRYFLS